MTSTTRYVLAFMMAVAGAVGAAACDNKTAPSPTVTGVTVTGNAALVNRNETSQLTAQATMSSGDPQDITNTATWTSSSASIASVNGTGLVTANGHGSATITAAFEGQSGNRPLTVTLSATPEVTAQFFRLCGPFRARMDVTMREASNNVGFNVTSLIVIMRDFFSVVRANINLSASDVSAMIGTNHLNAGESRSLSVTSAYPGNVDTADSTGTVSINVVDDTGNARNATFNVTFQRDGC